MNIKECPRCHSTKTGIINELNNNIQYGLVRIDRSKNPPNIDVGNVISVNVYGCAECGFIYLDNPDLIGDDPEA